jgi:DNA-binding MarR family transcriptional regulator
MSVETDLVQKIINCSHRLTAVGREMGAVTARGGAWGLMRSLRENGASTIPDLARARPVSRQHIRLLSQSLLQRGWIEQVPNPTHRRSFLLQLTASGASALAAMDRRIETYMSEWLGGVSDNSVHTTLETLDILAASLSRELAV